MPSLVIIIEYAPQFVPINWWSGMPEEHEQMEEKLQRKFLNSVYKLFFIDDVVSIYM